MAAQRASPVGFSEVIDLASLGIAKTDIKFRKVTLESDKFVCIREEKSLAIVNTATRNVLRLKIQVDSAIMNPVSQVVALRAGANLQIYNIEMKSKMKTCNLPGVVYWTWISPKTVAIVTQDAAYHWAMDSEAGPKKMFARAQSDGPTQVINYSASADGKWLLVGGVAAPQGGQIKGVLQVYSVDMKQSRPTMDSHAATFASVTLDGRSSPSNLFCFTRIDASGAKLNIIEVGVPKQQAFKQQAKLKFEGNDFPVAIQPDNEMGMLFVLSKAGFLFVYDIQSGRCLFAQKASRGGAMFASCPHTQGGVAAVSSAGRVAHFYIDRENIVNYISQNLNDSALAMKISARHNLGGAEGLFSGQFSQLMQARQFGQAIQMAANSPGGALRTIDTIRQLEQIPTPQGQSSYLLQYFKLLLAKGSLNAVESIELARKIMQKNPQAGLTTIKGWLQEKKLECSEELGDLLKPSDINIALSVYVRAEVPGKVIGCFLSLGANEDNDAKRAEYFNKIFRYAQQASFEPDYARMLAQLIRVNPARAKDLALLILRPENQKLDIRTMVRIFLQSNDVVNATALLLEYLRGRDDNEADGDLQTQVLEINLMARPPIAKAIMDSELQMSHYDRLKIAQLCERAQLFEHALEHYSDLQDIKRVLANSGAMNPEFLLDFFGRMTPANCLECLHDLLKYNMQAHLRLVVDVAKKWSDYLTPAKLIELFEEFKSHNGLYFYLGSLVNTTTDSDVILKFIQAAVKLGQIKEVERVCRDNEHYEPEEVKEYLLEQNLKDPRPLIHVCDRFGFVNELTVYLYQHDMFPFIEAYVQRMNPKAAPLVMGALLDLSANEEQVRGLLGNLRPPIDDDTFTNRLLDEVEKRNRLRILKEWLTARANEGSEDVHIHNGLAKIAVDTNSNAQQFLTTNPHYDSKVVGAYCESRDPHLAFIAYKRAYGECDAQLIEVTNKNGFFKDQARYLVERQDLELWETVLTPDNKFRRQLIDQVVATALPESQVPEEVSTTVKAFMAANLPTELIELLERIILHGPSDSAFHNNKNLQNLLILTAIKADKKRVMDYINRLDNYDGPDIAKIAISDQYQLYEEAFVIYKKFKKGPEAITVLLDNLDNIERATEFAEYWDHADVWSLLAKAELDHGMPKEAIASYLKADDPTNYEEVIEAAKAAELFVDLITYLKMAREKKREATIDNELVYAYARTEKLADLEEFIAGPSSAKLEKVGELCVSENLYDAGRIIFTHTNNNAKLAICLVHLRRYADAVEAARKAGAIPTWKEVCFACVDAEEFRLAQICGLNIIRYNDHLLDLIFHYEVRGYFDQCITLLDQGTNLDASHQGIFTQLGIMYAKYREDKLMDHIKLWHKKLNIPQLLGVCRENQHWSEVVYLYTVDQQADQAVEVLMEHSPVCWTHDLFKDTLKKVSNSELYYRSIDFYLEEHPLLLDALLIDVSPLLDHTRVVNQVRAYGADGRLELIKKYLHTVQHENLIAVNEAINNLCLAEEDHAALRASIDSFSDFDQIMLAQRIKDHDLLEFRRIAAYLYKRNKRYGTSIDLSKRDEQWGDAMETVAHSGDAELAESLLRFFVDQERKECFAACLFTCYELIPADVVLELAWRFDLMAFSMPYLIQTLRHYDERVETLTRKVEAQQAAADAADDDRADSAPPGVGIGQMPLSIMPPPGAMGGMPMGGMQMGGPPQMMGPSMGGPPPMGGMGGPPPHPNGGYGGGYGYS